MSKPARIGVLGGTFDPIHNTHLAMARTAVAHAKLDTVLFVVSARPPHKNEGPCASVGDRFAMVQAAVDSQPKMAASRLEMDRPGESYTRDTLEALARQSPDAALFLILGLDSLVDLPNWLDPGRILELARLLVVPRPSETRPIPPEVEGHYDILPFTENPVSSTEIRKRVAACESLEGLVPPAVERYIHEKGIYR